MTDLQRHPVAALFPEIEGTEFEQLVADITLNGQLEPIKTFQGFIIDGWNRYRACLAAEVTPSIVPIVFDDMDELIAFVTGKNLLRRHMTPSQLADVAVGISNMGHMTLADAAASVGVSRATATRAKRKSTGGKRGKGGGRRPAAPPSNETPKSNAIDLDALSSAEILDLATRLVPFLVENARPVAQALADALDAAGVAQSSIFERGRLEALSDENRDLKKQLEAMEADPTQNGFSGFMQLTETAQRMFFQSLGAYGRDKKQFTEEARAQSRDRKAMLLLVFYNACDPETRAKAHRLIAASPPAAAGAGGPVSPIPPGGNGGSGQRQAGDPIPKADLYPPGSQLKHANGKGRRSDNDGFPD